MDSKVKLPIGKKVLKDLSREKTIIFIILIQIFIIFASSILLDSSNALFNPQGQMAAKVNIGVYNADPNFNKTGDYFRFSDFIQQDHSFDFTVILNSFETKEIAYDAFRNGDVDGLLELDFKAEKPYNFKLILPKGEYISSSVASFIKSKLELFEDSLRHEVLIEKGHSKNELIDLNSVVMKNKASAVSASIFESLYQIVLPFIILLPAILLGGLLIDILFEDIEKKTLHLLMIITSFKKYLNEIFITIMGISLVQLIIWEVLLILNKITIANVVIITSISILLYAIIFLFAMLLILIVNDKTKSQIIYSSSIIILFMSTPISTFNPIRVISKLAIGLEEISFVSYGAFLMVIVVILYAILSFIADKKEW